MGIDDRRTAVSSGMQKRRAKVQSKLSKNLTELHDGVRESRPELFITFDNDPFIVEYNDDNLMLISPATAESVDVVFCTDGTFKCTPNKPDVQQLFVVGGLVDKAVSFLNFYFPR